MARMGVVSMGKTVKRDDLVAAAKEAMSIVEEALGPAYENGPYHSRAYDRVLKELLEYEVE